MTRKISPMLWYDGEAEAAAHHYIKAFKDGRIVTVERYPEGAMGPVGSVMTVAFEMAGQSFTALNGGPMFKPTEATSFVISCEDLTEVDRLWEHFSEGGSTQACGWVKDRWGYSWQITPRNLLDLVVGGRGTAEQKARAFAAMLLMTKIDVNKIEEAIAG